MKIKILIFTLLAFMLVGCSIWEDPDTRCPDSKESEFINLTFNMVVPIARPTRTDDLGHQEIDSEWPEFEDRIYTDDFAFFLYAVLSDDNQPFLAKIDDLASLIGSNGTYNLQIALEKSKFEEVVPAENKIVRFKIAVFANTDKKYDALTETDYASFKTLIGAASQWDYSIFNTIYDETDNARIPMYGTATFEATREQVYQSREERPLWGGEISLLRSVAKVQVIDNIANRDSSTGLPRIASVAFLGTTDKAYILPFHPLYYQNGHQVETPWICSGGSRELALQKINEESNQSIGYVPEQSTSGCKFIISVVKKLNGDGSAETERFEVPMTGYKDQTFNFGNDILRNHIYTLSVKNIETSNPIIEVSVKNWNKIYYYYEY